MKSKRAKKRTPLASRVSRRLRKMWDKMDVEVLAKSSLNAIRALNGLPRIRYVEKQPEMTNLWLMNDPFIVEKLPAGSVDVVNFVRDKNATSSALSLKKLVTELKKGSARMTESRAVAIIEKLVEKGILVKPTTSSDTSINSTDDATVYDTEFFSDVTVTAVKDSSMTAISPLGNFIWEQTRETIKSLPHLQSEYHAQSDVSVTMSDLFTYCQLLEQRNIVQVFHPSVPVSQQCSADDGFTTDRLGESSSKHASFAKHVTKVEEVNTDLDTDARLTVYCKKLDKLAKFHASASVDENVEHDWTEGLTTYFTRLLADVEDSLVGCQSQKKLGKLKQKLESVLEEEVNVNHITELHEFVEQLRIIQTNENKGATTSQAASQTLVFNTSNSQLWLRDSVLQELVIVFCQLLNTQLDVSKITDKHHKSQVKRIQSEHNISPSHIDQLLFINDAVIKESTDLTDVLAELCRIYTTLYASKKINVGDNDSDLIRLLDQSVSRVKQSMQNVKVTGIDEQYNHIESKLTTICNTLDNAKLTGTYSTRDILNLLETDTSTSSLATSRSAVVLGFRHMSLRCGLINCVIADINELYDQMTKSSPLRQRRSLYTRQSEFHGIAAKWNLTGVLSDDDIDSISGMAEGRVETTTLLNIVRILNNLSESIVDYERAQIWVSRLETKDELIQTIVDKLKDLINKRDINILREIEQLWIIDETATEIIDKSSRFRRFRARLAGSLVKSTITSLEKKAYEETNQRQKIQITERIRVIKRLTLTTRSELHELIRITDTIESRSVETFIAAELTRLFLLIDDAISDEINGANVPFRSALGVTRKVFTDYLNGVDKADLPEHLQVIYEKMLKIAQTLGFYLTMDAFQCRVLLEHLEHIIVS